ncbi:MAG TPA: AAA family ATPase, partial [Xanthomonadaceae bacterium]|nr:AAA family ATPase [Xanthomonadaceae bacterium]
MFDHNDLAALIRAGHPLIVVETGEEAMVVDAFRHVIALTWRPLWKWSLTRGLERLDMDMPEASPQGTDASQALRSIHECSERGIYLMLDFHPFLRYAMNLRLLREVCMRKGTAAHTIVMIAPKVELPEELKSLATPVEGRLPDEERLRQLVREEAFTYSRENGGRRVEIDAAALKAIVRNLRGLALPDARRVIRQIVHNDGAISDADLPEVAKAKFGLLNGDGLLHFEYEVCDPDQLAGMARLKRWVEMRRPVFVGEASAARLDPPKGILLLGVQGCGKSMAAKAVAGGFRVPLLRMDFGVLYNKYHGETERNLREALKSAEAMAPCVLWIDEIEKGLAQSDSDGG